MEVTRWEDTVIEGNVQAAEAGTLFTSIPYDKGWKVTVDGQERKGRKVLDAFFGLDLPAGSHEIRLEYHPPGLKAGAAVSAISLLFVGLAAWLGRGGARDVDEMEDGGGDDEDGKATGLI